MAMFCGVTSYSGFLSIGVYFVVSQSWCGVSRLLVEFLRVQVSLCVVIRRMRRMRLSLADGEV
jgi:hypothetical protein